MTFSGAAFDMVAVHFQFCVKFSILQVLVPSFPFLFFFFFLPFTRVYFVCLCVCVFVWVYFSLLINDS